MSYFSEIKHKDVATKQRFVVIGTAISFIAIIGVWVPIRIAQWRTPGDATVAKTEETAPLATATPAVAGDSAIRIFTNVASPTPIATTESRVTNEPIFANQGATATPGNDVPLLAPESTPSATDFPTL